MTDLYKSILNLEPRESTSDYADTAHEATDVAYLKGYADARHAAAELALSAPAVPQGYVLVPVEPTPEMAQALLDYAGNDELHWPTDVSPNYALAAYRVMVAAAPSAKEQLDV